MIPYRTVYQGGQGEIQEKKSRFIAQVFPVETEEEVTQTIEQIKKKYWDARHNCYAFVLGSRGEISRCSDDGEPSGTAGRPILEVITGQQLCNVLIVVTRYFGGTLLGTGGLVKAYSRAVQAGLADSRIITKQVGCRLIVDTDYNGVGKLQHIAGKMKLPVLDTVYTDRVRMILLIPTDLYGEAVKRITEATAGQAVLTKETEEVYFAEIEEKTVIF